MQFSVSIRQPCDPYAERPSNLSPGIGSLGASVIHLLLTSACAVRKLHLDYIPLTNLQIIECLRLLPSLVELIIQFRNRATSADTILKQLIHQPSKQSASPSLCPRLQDHHFGRTVGYKGSGSRVTYDRFEIGAGH